VVLISIPEKRADLLRPKMMKDGKYLITKIEGTGQERSPWKIVENYFRWKQYIGHHTDYEKEWITAPLHEVWSSKFLGLDKIFRSKDVKQVKKLEYQNPAYSAAYSFNGRNGDPRKYRKVFTVQLSGCTYRCNYCYVPEEINLANPELGKFFSPKEIIDNFLLIRKKSEIPMNVLRITGGEPTIIPEIIFDIYNELEKRDMNDIYLWIDTNLSTTKYLEKTEGNLKDLMKKRNVGIVGCFKGLSKEDFSIITGAEPKFYEQQFDTTKLFLDWKTDFYIYLPALAYKNNIEQKTREFISRLRELNKNLPLRVEMLIIKDYPGALKNIKLKEKEGRSMPKTDQRDVFELWYNKLLPESYSKDILSKFSCEVPL
jgi:uncharacterized Fe-S cluster-containing radical SAM superfamily protein